MGKFPIATPHWVPWGQIQSLAQRWEQRLQRMKDGTFQGWKESGDFYGDLGKQKHVIYCEIIRKWHAWVLQGGRVEVAPFLCEDLWALQGCTQDAIVQQTAYEEHDMALRGEVTQLKLEGLTAAAIIQTANTTGFAAVRLLAELVRPIAWKASSICAFKRAIFDRAGSSQSEQRLARWLEGHQGCDCDVIA